MGTSRLGSLLVEEGLLSEADRRTIKGTCGSHGPAFARSIIALGLLEEDELAAFLAEKTPWRVASKDLFADSDQGAWGVVDRPLLERLEVLPLKLVGQTLYVAMVDPLDQDTIKQLAFFSGYKIHPVISTLSHIRTSLKKLLKDYSPATSQLEELIANHAVAAGRRMRLADLKPGATKTPAAPAKAKAVEAVEEDFEIEEEAEAPLAAVAAAPSPGPAAALEYPDSVNAAESGDLDIEEEAAAAPAPAPANALSATDAAELMGEDPDGLDGLDDFGDDANADLKGEGDLLADLGDEPGDKPAAVEKKPSAMAAAITGADELEALADLSEFDPDKSDGGGLEDLDGDLGADLGADLVGEDGNVMGDLPLTGEDSMGELVVGGETVDDLGDLGGEKTADSALDDLLTAENGDDLASLAVSENDPADITLDDGDGPGIDAGDLDFAAPSTEAPAATVDPMDDLAGLEAAPEVGDDLLADDLLGTNTPSADDANPLGDELLATDDPLGGELLATDDALGGESEALGGDADPLGTSATESAGERLAASHNQTLLSLTMAKDLADGLARIAPALREAGLTRGILIDTSKGVAIPLLAWEPTANSGTAVKKDGLQAYVTPGLAPALARQFAGWTAFDDATRDTNLKPFAKWLDAKHQLRAAAVPLGGGRQLVVLAAWEQATREDAGIKSAAFEMVRRLAAKMGK